MPENELHFSREYDLPPGIVFDALIDEVLLEGWLAPARVDARIGGEYFLAWQGVTNLTVTTGVITALAHPSLLVVETDNIGLLEFRLDAVPGGTRGFGTMLGLRIAVDTHRRLMASTIAYWESNLDQLEDLLRGHPVDWTTWQEDRGEAWAAYLRRSAK